MLFAQSCTKSAPEPLFHAYSHVTPHIARNTAGRRSAIDGRTTRHPGYAASQRIRKRIEESFGWGKVVRAVAPHQGAGPRARRHGLRGLGRGLQPRPIAEAAVSAGGSMRRSSQGATPPHATAPGAAFAEPGAPPRTGVGSTSAVRRRPTKDTEAKADAFSAPC